MKTQAKQTGENLSISPEQLVSLVGGLFGGTSGNPNPDEPLKPGPWDPYIRIAFAELRYKLERQKLFPHEEAWRTLLTLGAFNGREEVTDALIPHSFKTSAIYSALLNNSFAELNPQPLPPRAMLLVSVTRQVVERILLIQETADLLRQMGNERGIIIVSGKINEFVDEIDELCPRLKIKIPKPKGWHDDRFSGLELLAASTIFQQNSLIVSNEELRNELRNAGVKLAEMSVDRL